MYNFITALLFVRNEFYLILTKTYVLQFIKTQHNKLSFECTTMLLFLHPLECKFFNFFDLLEWLYVVDFEERNLALTRLLLQATDKTWYSLKHFCRYQHIIFNTQLFTGKCDINFIILNWTRIKHLRISHASLKKNPRQENHAKSSQIVGGTIW